MRKITAIAALGAVAGGAHPYTASADTLAASIGLSATVAAGCTSVAQSAPFTFPAVLVQGTQPIVPGAITTTCAATVPAIITFNSGKNAASGTTVPRLSTNNASSGFLAYGLWSSSIPHIAAGVVTGTAVVLGAAQGAGISVTGTGSAVTTNLWAALVSPVPSDIPAGTYSDTIAVTLTF